jgi:hypothetical protein
VSLPFGITTIIEFGTSRTSNGAPVLFICAKDLLLEATFHLLIDARGPRRAGTLHQPTPPTPEPLGWPRQVAADVACYLLACATAPNKSFNQINHLSLI